MFAFVNSEVIQLEIQRQTVVILSILSVPGPSHMKGAVATCNIALYGIFVWYLTVIEFHSISQ